LFYFLWKLSQATQTWRKINIFIAFMVGLFLGNYNEIFFVSVLLAYTYALAYHFFIEKGFSWLFYKQTLGFLLGFVLAGVVLMFAPGNFERQKSVDAGQVVTLLDKWNMLLNDFQGVRYLGVVLGMLLVCILLYAVYVIKQNKQKKWLRFVFFSGFLVSLYALFIPLANILSARMFMLLAAFLFMVFFALLNRLVSFQCLQSPKYVWGFSLANIAIFALFLFVYFGLYVFEQERRVLIKKHQEEQVDIAVFPTYTFPKGLSKIVYYDDISEDTNHWKNHCFAKYYGFKAVKLD
jgi:MFS family permease